MKNIKTNENKKIVKIEANLKNLIELIIGRFILYIILGMIATGVLFGILWIIGTIVGICEKYLIARIILFIIGILTLGKLVSEAE